MRINVMASRRYHIIDCLFTKEGSQVLSYGAITMFPFMKEFLQRGTPDELIVKHNIWKNLYKKLDVHRNGRVDAAELIKGLEEIPKDGLKAGDFEEFRKYLAMHKMKIMLGFGSIEKNRNNKIGALKIIGLMKKLNIHLNIYQAKKILEHLDENDYMTTGWNEWHKIYITEVEDNMISMIDIWRFNSIFSINDDITNCEEFLENKVPEKWLDQLIAGGTAGGVSRTVTAPFDRLRVLMQVYSTRQNKMKISSGLRAMIAEGGISSMWRGNLTNIIKIGPELAFKFMAYEELKNLLAGDSEQLGMKERFLAGSMAGAFSQTATFPVEMLKTRMTLRKTGEPRELYAHVRNIFLYEGISTFYRGYVPNILGIIPYAGIDLAVYETLKNLWIQRYTTGNEGPNILLVVGSATTSNVVGQLASYPLMVIHTRMQAEVIGKGERKPRMREYFRHILVNNGVLGFYRGFTANLIKAIPSVCISYILYEYLKRKLGLNSL
ncbi:mitochondrial adenyl nucleotide antiporter SLC25A24-like [Heptranchias perlo]|uniref:mitochondrial adenyl nucleotide antiporter SLC25A24-like n=1 Tax=Heptranchias perlo TaxID=212740 RepID=UPI00355A6429